MKIIILIIFAIIFFGCNKSAEYVYEQPKIFVINKTTKDTLFYLNDVGLKIYHDVNKKEIGINYSYYSGNPLWTGNSDLFSIVMVEYPRKKITK